MKKLNEFILNPPSWTLIIPLLTIVLVILSIYCEYLRIWLLIASGLSSGFFYSINDYRIFDFPYEDEFEVMRLKEKKYNVHRIILLTHSALTHKFILHMICGVLGSIAFYLLLSDKIINEIIHCKTVINKLTIGHLVLFIIAILGYLGYLPRTFWFFAQKGGPAK